MAACVLVEKSEGVGILTMNRSEELKAMWLATMIAKNNRASVMGVEALLLKHMGSDLETPWANERDYITKVARGAKGGGGLPGVHRAPGPAVVVVKGAPSGCTGRAFRARLGLERWMT